MKIGILTFHCAHNYGALLQAYALQETIKSLGYDVDIIDYQPKYITEVYKPFSKERIFAGNLKTIIKKLIHAILIYPLNLRRWRVFNHFIRTNLNISKEPIEIIYRKYNLFIIGSDQIWNYKLTNGFDKVYWGFFKTQNTAKKITYAASFGNAEKIQKETLFLEKALKNFDDISLRENEYLEFIQSIRKNKVYKVLDPTLILDNSKWNNIAVKPNNKNNYVLVYQVVKSFETNRIALKIANQLECDLIEIPAKITYKNLKDKYNAVNPFEFIGWIKYATCIVTTSFHGTAFSIMYKKDFYTLNLEDGLEKRPKDLLYSLNLSDRLINKGSYVDFEEIDYSLSDQLLSKLKSESLEYLKSRIELVDI